MASELLNQLKDLEQELGQKIEQSPSDNDLEGLRIEYLGKKGKLTSILKGLGKVTPEERAEVGKAANQLKAQIEERMKQRSVEIQKEYYESLSDTEWYDITRTGSNYPEGFYNGPNEGHIHPISTIQKRLESIFTSLGFSIVDGPQVETDFYNFGALNFTEDHPAREMQDTFYTENGSLLRTHTSSMQVRALQYLQPPLRIVAPGRVFRYEEVDASHEHTFYQMEGMVIDKEISVSHLLFLMSTLLKEIFEKEVEIRLRPGYFPFVEPGFELDMKCLICRGEGCAVCKKTGWVEVLPCGLVHPNVLKSGGLDPEKWQGAAFGLGLNRLVMMRYGIEDIRYFQNAQPEFLYQF